MGVDELDKEKEAFKMDPSLRFGSILNAFA